MCVHAGMTNASFCWKAERARRGEFFARRSILFESLMESLRAGWWWIVLAYRGGFKRLREVARAVDFLLVN